MTNVLALLIVASGFSAAVETKSGFVERTFSNTAAGVEEFLDFAEPLAEAAGQPIKVCTVTLTEDGGAVMDWLLEESMGPASLSTQAYLKYAKKHNESADSPTTVAKACLALLPIRPRK
ncbi:hypothetical protein [Rhizobacter sp. LjRoot28]|uniref:hypothetical protein n=1 Tax=Rhizobacter sp. LjRoot28 TaxID=3342309 RepID=UPI003ECE3EA2